MTLSEEKLSHAILWLGFVVTLAVGLPPILVL